MSCSPSTFSRALLGAALLVSLSAAAYVLPQGAILRRMVEARSELQLVNVRVEGAAILSGPAQAQAASALGLPADRPELSLDGTLSLKLPGRCRLEVGTPDGKRVGAVMNAGRRKSVGPEVAALSAALEQVCPLLAARSGSDSEARAALEQHIRSLGVAAQRSSLARFSGEVTYVLGDPAEGKSQLWVYKDTFRPARVRSTDKAGTVWDVRFIDFDSPTTGEWMPRTIEVWRGNERALRFTALKGDSRAQLADSLFAL
ncbi:hypothetical protein FGE12_14950 [Aggregicoccus sp. 17bor-14]|uniref:LolA family protein n=1 Tax=Myxococcaceae TaxID=31 RepID=UPI00129CF81E|nr:MULTISPECIES: hypothetical protein [Myxococcaceae]MBF5043693.1 hypothetical protein [Simulacricoccus sp. 17bor-14]MRI89449.1 hypothetical protein [Aggregicoccus sp. 17bor-14]